MEKCKLSENVYQATVNGERPFYFRNNINERHLAVDALTHFAKADSTINLIFLYGDNGSGKTHLIDSFIAENQGNCPYSNIYNAQHLDFQENLIEFNGRQTDFIEDICSHDILILDDINFVLGKLATEKILVDIFDRILKKGGRVLVTSLFQPERYSELSKFLLTCERGLVIDIPMYEGVKA